MNQIYSTTFFVFESPYTALCAGLMIKNTITPRMIITIDPMIKLAPAPPPISFAIAGRIYPHRNTPAPSATDIRAKIVVAYFFPSVASPAYVERPDTMNRLNS